MNTSSLTEIWTLICVAGLAFIIFGSLLTVIIYTIMRSGIITEDDFLDYSNAPDILAKIASKLRKRKPLSAEENHWLQWAQSVDLVEKTDTDQYIPGRLMRMMLCPESRSEV